jgi:hypothetical protein
MLGGIGDARIRTPRNTTRIGRFGCMPKANWPTHAQARGQNCATLRNQMIAMPGNFAHLRGGAANYAVARRSLRWALRSKNNAWLMTAETAEGWNGLAIKNAGSGRSPVRNRSG